MARLEGVIYDLGNEGTEDGDHGCGERVKGAGGWLHFLNDGLNLLLRGVRETAQRLGTPRLWVFRRNR